MGLPYDKLLINPRASLLFIVGIRITYLFAESGCIKVVESKENAGTMKFTLNGYKHSG